MPPEVRPPLDPTLAVAIAQVRQSAEDAGYARALADVLAAAVYLAEQSLRDERRPADARAVLYRFVGKLERETRRLAGGDGTVSDGGGI